MRWGRNYFFFFLKLVSFLACLYAVFCLFLLVRVVSLLLARFPLSFISPCSFPPSIV